LQPADYAHADYHDYHDAPGSDHIEQLSIHMVLSLAMTPVNNTNVTLYKSTVHHIVLSLAMPPVININVTLYKAHCTPCTA